MEVEIFRQKTSAKPIIVPLDALLSNPPKYPYFCECIRDDTPIKPYFDLDHFSNEPVSDKDNDMMLHTALDWLNSEFEGNFAICCANRYHFGKEQYKTSYHIVSTDYKTNLHQLREFAIANKARFKELNLDTSVYSAGKDGRKLRGLNSTQHDEPSDSSRLRPITYDREEQTMHFVTLPTTYATEWKYIPRENKATSLPVINDTEPVIDTDADSLLAKGLVDIITPDNIGMTTQQWRTCGFILKTLNKYDLFVKLSQRSRYFNQEGLDKFWNGISTESYSSIGTLIYMAKQSDPLATADCLLDHGKGDIVPLIKKSLSKQSRYVAELAYYLLGRDWVICRNTGKIYYFNRDITVWQERRNLNQLREQCYQRLDNVYTRYGQYLEGLICQTDSEAESRDKRLKMVEGIISSIGKNTPIKNIVDSLTPLIEIDNFTEKLNDNKDELHFRNGKIDLRTGLFLKRQRLDYISQIVDYDYQKSTDSELEKINSIFDDTFGTDTENHKKWLGYCLTGETHAQCLLFHSGPSASNGKSTISGFMLEALPIYCLKMANDTFSSKNQKKHKEFGRITKSIRFVAIEELDQSKLDTDKLKEVVDGKSISTDILFSTSATLEVRFKLNCLMNGGVTFKPDEGILRRGQQAEYCTQFVDEPTKPHQKKADPRLRDMMSDPKWRCAFINALLPYAKRVYDSLEQGGKGYYRPFNWIENFNEVQEENDEIAEWFENHPVTDTGLDSDRIHKDEIMEQLNAGRIGSNIFKLSDIKTYIAKKFGNNRYQRTKRKDGKKGVFVGLKFETVMMID